MADRFGARRAAAAAEATQATMETIAADIADIKTATEAAAVDLAAMEVLDTARNTKLDTIATNTAP